MVWQVVTKAKEILNIKAWVWCCGDTPIIIRLVSCFQPLQDSLFGVINSWFTLNFKILGLVSLTLNFLLILFQFICYLSYCIHDYNCCYFRLFHITSILSFWSFSTLLFCIFSQIKGLVVYFLALFLGPTYLVLVFISLFGLLTYISNYFRKCIVSSIFSIMYSMVI